LEGGGVENWKKFFFLKEANQTKIFTGVKTGNDIYITRVKNTINPKKNW